MTNLVFKYLSVITGNITEYLKLLEIQPDTHAYPPFKANFWDFPK